MREPWKLNCPYCGAESKHAHGLPGTKGVPADGDVCICAQCAYLSVFISVMGKLGVRLPTDHEASTLFHEPDVIAAQEAAIRITKTRPSQTDNGPRNP